MEGENWAMHRRPLGQVIWHISLPCLISFPELTSTWHHTIHLIYMLSVLSQRKAMWKPELYLSDSWPCHFLLKQLPLHSRSPVITFWMNNGQYIQYYFSRKKNAGRFCMNYCPYPLILRFWWHNLKMWSRENCQPVWNESHISIRSENKGCLRPDGQTGTRPEKT